MLALVFLAFTVRHAAAHGGPLVYSGNAGNYRIEAYRIVRDVAKQRAVRYLLHVNSRMTGERIDDAAVTVTVIREDETIGPLPAVWVDGEYEVQFVMSRDRGWMVELRIDGVSGSVSIAHPLPSPASWLGLAATYGTPLLVIAGVWVVQRRLRNRGRDRALLRPSGF
jgi:hypothetical protein